MELADRLKWARMQRGMSQVQLGMEAGVSQTTIASIESGRAAGSKHLVAIARALKVDPYWLENGKASFAAKSDASTSSTKSVGGDENGNGAMMIWEQRDDLPDDGSRVWIDRYDYSVSAGDGSIQWEVREKHALPFNRGFFKAVGSRPEDCRLLVVKGDSMEPFLFDKDMVMVDTSKTTPREGKVFAIEFEHEALVKQIFKEAPGALRLHSYNPRYPDKLIPETYLDRVTMIGQVIYRSGSGMNL